MTIKVNNEIYYTVRDLVDLLSLTEITIRSHLRSGKIKGNKAGHFWYVSGKSLRLFLEGDKKRFLGVF